MSRKTRLKRLFKRQRIPGRWVDGRFWRPRRNLLRILIERKVTEEPIVVEPRPGTPPWRPAGFWRGRQFHRVTQVFGWRRNRGVMHVRVLSDRSGVYELRRTLELDPWTWRSRYRWELVAIIGMVLRRRLPSDPHQWIWPRGARR